MAAAPVWSVDPRTGKQREQVAVEATAQEVDEAVRAAHAARPALADRTVRAAFLRTAADQLEGAKDQLVEAADAESALGPVRLTGNSPAPVTSCAPSRTSSTRAPSSTS